MLSVTPELSCAASVGGVEINTSKCGPLNWEHLCPSGPQLQGLFGGHLDPAFNISEVLEGIHSPVCFSLLRI